MLLNKLLLISQLRLNNLTQNNLNLNSLSSESSDNVGSTVSSVRTNIPASLLESFNIDKEVSSLANCQQNTEQSNNVVAVSPAVSSVEPALSEDSPSFHGNSTYEGDIIDNSEPLRDTLQSLPFPDPAVFLAYYDKGINEGKYNLHKWQTDTLQEAAYTKATAQEPHKFCLLTCNGSGKDAIIIAGWAAWFCACKIRSRCIITSASGVQLTGQTENYIRALCQKINEVEGAEIFKIRQRYIKCRLSGSEIRMFATDEAGKAEGYHPIEPGAEMTIIVNEGKTVTEEIHGALRRCTGYNYWFEISSAGEPSGSFYKAYTNWKHIRRVTAYDCPHISRSEIEDAKRDLGENSALFRSIYLALFTSIGGQLVITQELIDKLLLLPFEHTHTSFGLRIGIDLAAGGDENCIIVCSGNKCIAEIAWRETDTEITADRIDIELSKFVSKSHPFIFADDGGVGRSIIDKLWRKGWKINRVLNQSAAISKKQYGNKAAENWYRVARILEERFFDVSSLSEKCREQLYTRHYKSVNNSGRIFLETKKEAKAEGRPSPDRADAFILSQTGLTVDDYIKESGSQTSTPADKRPKEQFRSPAEVLEHYENTVTFANFDPAKVLSSGKRIYNSLRAALRN